MGGGDAGGQVGGAGAGGGEAHTHLSGGAGIAVCGVGGALLVGGQNVADPALIPVQFVIDVQDGAAGIAEDSVHLLFQQTFQDGLGGADLQSAFLLLSLRLRTRMARRTALLPGAPA